MRHKLNMDNVVKMLVYNHTAAVYKAIEETPVSESQSLWKQIWRCLPDRTIVFTSHLPSIRFLWFQLDYFGKFPIGNTYFIVFISVLYVEDITSMYLRNWKFLRELSSRSFNKSFNLKKNHEYIHYLFIQMLKISRNIH